MAADLMNEPFVEPRVSILILSYNQQDYIREAIDSALAQDYDNFEIIVADDASTDATPDIIRSYASSYPDRVVPVLNRINQGITANSNSGLKKVSGRYFTHLGGDDTIEPGKLRTQVRRMETYPDLVLCAHQVEVFYEDEDKRPHLLQGLLTTGEGPDQLLRHGGLGALSVMVRTASIPAHGFEPSLRMISDYMLWAEILAGGGKFVVLPEMLGRYRQHSSNVTRDPTKYVNDVHDYYTLFERRYPQYAKSCRYGLTRHALYDPGVALLGLGRFQEAMPYFRRAVRQDPVFVKAWVRMAQCQAGVVSKGRG